MSDLEAEDGNSAGYHRRSLYLWLLAGLTLALGWIQTLRGMPWDTVDRILLTIGPLTVVLAISYHWRLLRTVGEEVDQDG